ncbi:glycosyltransferase family 4 protein [Marinomonas mediterranea]|jgi:Glycosyltransferase|uniref:Glycosyl transferase group 1 n=1 Tax=Marinomonas mediterranea (strain ATCC 700492 / JCM 21426 / NBRC 103028 / MMB-1) TaxID=717774 RepID=F2K2I1_MARM1|nr:glycosyltransferase family 4 protein [Marinomonas mediterranea]ADZ90026.1 glycosyl transferase group 1 [Marinomonas mediterranea MMB-1]WCN16234.1 glycosyltransferase [Marinomonas mediterranea MMB-1]
MTNITLFVDSSGIGGIETHIIQLAKALKAKAFPVQVILWKRYRSEPHIIESSLSTMQIPVSCADGSVQNLRDQVLPHSTLHTHGYKANLIGKFGHSLGWWKTVPTHHNGDLGTGKLKLYVKLDEITSQFFSPISVSQEIFNRLKHKGIKLKNFVNYEPVTQSPLRNKLTPRVAFVGRLSDEKDPNAFCQLANQFQGRNCEFHVYGEGALHESLKNAYPTVLFHGQTAMESEWDNIDLLCITSKTEGLPLAVLEAMSRGIPIAAFGVGDLPEIIKDGFNGWLIPPGNLNKMHDAVEQWLSLHPFQTAGMMYHAERTIKNEYSQDVVVPQLLSHYPSSSAD